MIRVSLKDVLQERRLSLRELARRLNKHPDTISKFGRQKTGGVSYELLSEICAGLGCNPGELLRYEPDLPEQIALFTEMQKDSDTKARSGTGSRIGQKEEQ